MCWLPRSYNWYLDIYFIDNTLSNNSIKTFYKYLLYPTYNWNYCINFCLFRNTTFKKKKGCSYTIQQFINPKFPNNNY